MIITSKPPNTFVLFFDLLLPNPNITNNHSDASGGASKCINDGYIEENDEGEDYDPDHYIATANAASANDDNYDHNYHNHNDEDYYNYDNDKNYSRSRSRGSSSNANIMTASDFLKGMQ